jgi:hypothetical protein
MKQAIRTRGKTILTALALVVLGGCASPFKFNVDHQQGYNFAAVSRVGWLPQHGQVSGSNPLALSDMRRDRLNLALEQALTAKGITVSATPANAQLYLTWHLVTQEKVDIRTTSSPSHYGGVGRYNRVAMYNCWNCGMNTDVSVREYTTGSLIVDLIDPAAKKSVWRGVIETRIKDKAERRQEVFNEAANELFEAFPPPRE